MKEEYLQMNGEEFINDMKQLIYFLRTTYGAADLLDYIEYDSPIYDKDGKDRSAVSDIITKWCFKQFVEESK